MGTKFEVKSATVAAGNLTKEKKIIKMNNCNIFLVFEVFTIQLTFELFILN